MCSYLSFTLILNNFTCRILKWSAYTTRTTQSRTVLPLWSSQRHNTTSHARLWLCDSHKDNTLVQRTGVHSFSCQTLPLSLVAVSHFFARRGGLEVDQVMITQRNEGRKRTVADRLSANGSGHKA